MVSEREWLSTAEAARLLGVSERTVLRLIARGSLAAWRWDVRARWQILSRSAERLLKDRAAVRESEMSEMSEMSEI